MKIIVNYAKISKDYIIIIYMNLSIIIYIETMKINIKFKIKEIFDIKPKSMTYLLKILINMQIFLL
jgi:hypothetical protein